MTNDNIRHFPKNSQRGTRTFEIAPRFEVVDSSRFYAITSLDRFIMDVFEHLEPLDYRDGLWKTLPLRLTHDSGAGWQIECGPFNFDAADIERFREAIAAYDDATGTAR